jgi:hypothetical protein
MIRRTVSLLIVVAGLASASAAYGDTGLHWKVAARFRLWSAAADTPERAADLEALLTQVAGGGEVYGAVKGFRDRQTENLLKHSPWNVGTAGYDSSYVYPRSYGIQAGLNAPPPGAACDWLVAGRVVQAAVDCRQEVTLNLAALAAPSSGTAPTPIEARLTGGGAVLAAETVTVRDVLIASLGDSFASGEGNPDIPTNWKTREDYSGYWSRRGDWHNRWMGRRTAVRSITPPVWWDSRCHRSFYSQHLVAALKLAADRLHQATTLMTYACSGAAVFNGLLWPQYTPPGYTDDNRVPKLKIAQIEALNRDLCPPDEMGARQMIRAEPPRYVNAELLNVNGAVRPLKPGGALAYRCTSPGRSVDAVLLTIGGNDVGFSRVIFDAMLPRKIAPGDPLGKLSLNVLRNRLATLPETAQASVLRLLPSRLKEVSGRLKVVAPGAPVLHTGYPDPMVSARGEPGVEPELCGAIPTFSGEFQQPKGKTEDVADDQHGSLDRLYLTALDGAWPDRFVDKEKRWAMFIDQEEASHARSTMIAALNAAIAKGQDKTWKPVSFGDAFVRHGWCVDADYRALPNYESVATPGSKPPPPAWIDGWSPQKWEPYKPRERYFRTPNDAALTQISVRPRTFLGPFSQLSTHFVDVKGRSALLGAMSGAFHPTFQAHVVMGLKTSETLETVLAQTP